MDNREEKTRVRAYGIWKRQERTGDPQDQWHEAAASPGFGASERFVVAPGHEETGIFHMPTTQTGPSLSPYYNQGHEDWVQGRASPFLLGEPKWRTIFQPQ